MPGSQGAATHLDYNKGGLAAPRSAENVAPFLGEDGGIVCAAAGSEQALNFLKTELGVAAPSTPAR